MDVCNEYLEHAIFKVWQTYIMNAWKFRYHTWASSIYVLVFNFSHSHRKKKHYTLVKNILFIKYNIVVILIALYQQKYKINRTYQQWYWDSSSLKFKLKICWLHSIQSYVKIDTSVLQSISFYADLLSLKHCY